MFRSNCAYLTYFHPREVVGRRSETSRQNRCKFKKDNLAVKGLTQSVGVTVNSSDCYRDDAAPPLPLIWPSDNGRQVNTSHHVIPMTLAVCGGDGKHSHISTHKT